MEYKNIEFEITDRVAIIRFNIPEVLNALSRPVLVEMVHAIGKAGREDSGARCLLITGNGRAFSSGANLQGRNDPASAGPEVAGSALESDFMPLMHRLRELPFPMVTAVNGVAAGVGMSVALMADMVVASKSAYFLQAFARIGLVPDGGATWLLPRMIGWSRAVELSLLAERLSAEEAHSWGLINRVVEDDQLMDEAMGIARRLANGPASLNLIRKAYWASMTNSYAEQMQLESDLQRQASASADHKEGVTAFLEKRDASFTGR